MKQPNILFVILDTVRAQNMSLYDYKRETSPFLKQFARKSILYRNAFAPAPWTTPSHAAMFTGSFTAEHQTNRSKERLTPDLPSLAELLGRAGYETVGFSNNIHVSPQFGFDHGFDQFTFNKKSYNEPLDGGVSISELRSHTSRGSFAKQAKNALQYVWGQDMSLAKTMYNWLYRKGSEKGLISNRDRGAKATNAYVDSYLQRTDDTPFFIFLNYMEAHAPYQTPSKYQYQYVIDPAVSGWENRQDDYFRRQVPDQKRKVTDLEDQYDGCIRYLDSQLKVLINTLKQHGVFNDTLVIVGSDHGEGFGEHGLYEHKTGVFNELTHVPLIINAPTQEARVVETPVSMRWIFSTLLSVADVDIPRHVKERSLLEPGDYPVIIESEPLPYNIDYATVDERFAASQKGIVDYDTHLKLISYDYDGSSELYEIGDESTNIIDTNQLCGERLAETLEERLQEYGDTKRSDAEEPIRVDDDTRRHLYELGYR